MAEKAPQSKTIGYALLHAARLHRARMAQLLAELGLFPGQEQVLAALGRQDGRTIGDLATLLKVRPPTISKMIARLTAQGLLERRASTSDARLVRVHLTEEGARRAVLVESVWNILEMEAVEHLGAKDRKRLRKALRTMAKNLAVAVGSDASPVDEDDDGSAAEPE